jgi:type IV pilus assembly protein PilM
MSTAVLTFDPYVAWLDVTSERRPLGPYELLRLSPLEANTLKINAAVIRQRQLLESFRIGANEEHWERVRQELEAAISTLTNSESKALLDASLIRKASGAGRKKSSGQKSPAGETIGCRKCQKQNSSQRRFCGECGDMLWEECGACSAEVPVDEKFCGICGANLQDTVSAEHQQAQQMFQEAVAFRKQYDYAQAITLARKVAKSHDPRLDDLAEKALALIAEIEAEIARREQDAADALDRAKMLLSGHAYEGAIAELGEIPPRFRTEEMEQTLAEAQARRKEILTLSGEIREGLEQKRYAELLPKIERLLTLKPGHEASQKLAAQLRDRLLATAKKRLAEHRYADAAAALHQIPSFVHTPEVDKLQDQSDELQWLVSDLQLAPLADQALEEIAERLAKAAAGNPLGAKLKQQIVERRAAALADKTRHRYHAWAKPPQRTHLSCSIDWLTGCESFRLPNAEHAELFRAEPGRFFVALGLALQGIDKAPLDMNLIKQEKKFSLKQLSSFSLLRKKTTKAAWGIDLNTTGLKAVKLLLDEKDNTVVVADACYLKHRKLTSQPDAENERGAIISETLAAFLAKHSLADARIVCNLPAHRLLGRFFDLPPLELKRVEDAVLFEAKHQIPYPMAELAWDWSLVSAREVAEHEEPRRIALIAGRDYHLQDRLGTLRAAGIEPEIVTCDCLALHNFILHEFYSRPDSDGGEAIALLDVGAECTSLVITSPSVHWFRTFNIGGDNFTEPLVRQFKLTYAQAEHLKREPFRVKRLSQLYSTFDPLFAALVSEIERSLDTFAKLYPDQILNRLYGVGGGFPLHGLWKALVHGADS